MRRRIVACVVPLLALLFAAQQPAVATKIFLTGPATVEAGDSFGLDVWISGLGAYSPPSVGGFDLSVTFNPSILAATGVTFGSYLGDPLSIQLQTILPGSVDLAEVSLLFWWELEGLQPDSFPLATLAFDALGTGKTALQLVRSDIVDDLGTPLPAEAEDGSVVVVPEPGTFMLLGVGLALLGAARRRTGRSSAQGPGRRHGEGINA